MEVKRLPTTTPGIERIPEVGNPEASQLINPLPVTDPPLNKESAASTDNTGNTGNTKTIVTGRDIAPAKRGPGRPPGSTNKNKEPPKKPAPRGKTGPPDFTEWQDFIGGVLIHWICVAFVSVALRGISRDILSADDKDDLELDEEEEMLIAKPLSTWLTNSGSGFNTKYGRIVINLRESIEAMVILAFYMGRVNRVAKKYRPRHARKDIPKNVTRISDRTDRVSAERKIDSEPAQFPPPGFRFPNAGSPGVGFN